MGRLGRGLILKGVTVFGIVQNQQKRCFPPGNLMQRNATGDCWVSQRAASFLSVNSTSKKIWTLKTGIMFHVRLQKFMFFDPNEISLWNFMKFNEKKWVWKGKQWKDLKPCQVRKLVKGLQMCHGLHRRNSIGKQLGPRPWVFEVQSKQSLCKHGWMQGLCKGWKKIFKK